MSDTNTTAQIDSLVAASGSPDPALTRSQSTADMRVDGDGNVTVLYAPATTGRIHDTGLDLGGAVSGIEADIARIQSELDEVTFDPKTGKPTQVRTGNDRATREAQLVSLKAAREYQVSRNAALQAQRDADAAARTARDTETARRFQFSRRADGTIDPARAEAYDKAKLAAEAEAVIRGR